MAEAWLLRRRSASKLCARENTNGIVRAGRAPELGWSVIHSDDPELVGNGPWFQWHSDRWTVPPGAVEIARNAAASQAFVLGRSLAVQFHPELTSAMLDGWLGNGGDAAVRAAGLDIDALRLQTGAEQAAAAARAHALVNAFLDLPKP